VIILTLHPFNKTIWPRKKPVRLNSSKGLDFRNWHFMFDVITAIPTKEIPENVVVVHDVFGDKHESTTSALSGERLRYASAAKVASVLDYSLRKWEGDKSGEEKKTFKLFDKMYRKINRLPGRTPVILDWH